MTPSDRYDSLITEWLAYGGRDRAPRGTLDAVLDRTRSMRPLPAWRARVSVPHMRREATVLVGSPIARRLAIAAALAAVVLASALAIAGAMLLRTELGKTQVFVYVANPASLPAEFCADGRDCRNSLAAWPGGRFLLSQRVGTAEADVLVEAAWPSTIVEHHLAPSGRYVAYARTQRNYPASCLQLMVADLTSGEERFVAEITGDWVWVPDPVAANGDRLVLATGGHCSAGPAGVVVFDADTGSADRVLDFENVFGPLDPPSFGSPSVWLNAVHPDRQHLLVEVLLPGQAPGGVYIVPIDEDAGPPVPIACDCGATGGIWSPDGSWLLLETGRGSLWLAQGDGSGAREVAGLASSPSWSPDSASIVYLAADLGTVSDRDERGIFVVAAAGGQPVQIARMRTPHASLVTPPRWSPDGAWIYWSDLDGTWAIRPGGTDLRLLDLPAQIDLRWVIIEHR
jgi:hypothetical protein